MKGIRILSGVLCLCILLFMLTGCEKKQTMEEKTDLNIYASFYPFYALASTIVEDVPDMKVHCLAQPQDGCIRNYRLSDWDAALLSTADAVLIGGRGLESYEAALYSMGEKGPAIVSLLYNMDLNTYSPDELREETHWMDENPHIYLKTDGAIQIAERIAASFIEMDPEYSGIYAENLNKVKNRLKSVKEEISTVVGSLKGTPAVIMNEALVYVAEEYGLKIECCIDRESGEGYDERKLKKLIDLFSAGEAKLILIEKQAPQRLCADLEAAGFAVARLDVLSTHSENEDSEGYFEALRANAAALAAAFESIGEDNV